MDGNRKDTIVPGLTPGYILASEAVDAIFGFVLGNPQAQALPKPDQNGQPITRERLLDDAEHVWKPSLQALYEHRGGLTPRDIQKTFGLEWGRTCYGPEFFTDIVRTKVALSTADIVLIDDVRFPADWELVGSLNGTRVKIVRPSATAIDSHQSEGLLENHAFDITLDNSGTLEAYETEIRQKLIPIL